MLKVPRVCLKGNSPEQELKVPKSLLSEIKKVFDIYNQEMGLEAAIFWRPRNRALVYFVKKFNISQKHRRYNGSKLRTEILYIYY